MGVGESVGRSNLFQSLRFRKKTQMSNESSESTLHRFRYTSKRPGKYMNRTIDNKTEYLIILNRIILSPFLLMNLRKIYYVLSYIYHGRNLREVLVWRLSL